MDVSPHEHPTVLSIKALANVFFMLAVAILLFAGTVVGAVLVGFAKNTMDMSRPELATLMIGCVLISAVCIIFGMVTYGLLKYLNYTRLSEELKKS